MSYIEELKKRMYRYFEEDFGKETTEAIFTVMEKLESISKENEGKAKWFAGWLALLIAGSVCEGDFEHTIGIVVSAIIEAVTSRQLMQMQKRKPKLVLILPKPPENFDEDVLT